MTKQIDKDFFRDLILHCLDYVPEKAKKATNLPEIKTLRSMRSIINFIRSDNYSWFLMLMSSIPPNDWFEENLTAQVCCITLNDKNEEFLLSCSVLVQLAHFVIMRDGCFSYIDVAASCLSAIFKEKYLERFSRTNDWNEFVRYCEITKRKFFRDTGVSCQPGRSSNGKDISLFWNQIECEIMLQACFERVEDFMRVGGENRPFVFDYTSYLKQRIRRLGKSLEVGSSWPLLANFLRPASLRYLGALWRYYFAYQLQQDHQNPLTWEAQMLDSIKKASEAPTEENSPVTKNTNCPKAENKFCLGCILTASHSEELKVQLNRNFQSYSLLDVLISKFKVIKDIFLIGKTTLNRIVLTSCLTISRVLKSKVHSLLKLFFYTLGLFRQILFRKRRSVESQPALDTLTLEYDSIESKETPQTLDCDTGECALIPEDDSIENVSLTDFNGKRVITTPRFEVKSAGSTFIAKYAANKTISSAQEESTVIDLHSDVESKHKSSSLSGVKAKDPCASDKLFGRQSLEDLLNNVQSILMLDWIHRFFLLKVTFCRGDMQSFECLICPSCNTVCAMITISDCFVRYVCENFFSKTYRRRRKPLFGLKGFYG